MTNKSVKINRIKELRLKRGLNQEFMSNELGVSQQTLSRYENNIDAIKIDILVKISEYFHVTTDYILGLSDIKRDHFKQTYLKDTIELYFDLIENYKALNDDYKELICYNISKLKELQK